MNNTSRTLVTLVAGAVAGAVTALLLAPASGEETRQRISDASKKARNTLNDTLQQGLDKIQTLGGSAKSEAREGMNHLSAAANEVKNDAKHAVKKGIDSL